MRVEPRARSLWRTRDGRYKPLSTTRPTFKRATRLLSLTGKP